MTSMLDGIDREKFSMQLQQPLFLDDFDMFCGWRGCSPRFHPRKVALETPQYVIMQRKECVGVSQSGSLLLLGSIPKLPLSWIIEHGNHAISLFLSKSNTYP